MFSAIETPRLILDKTRLENNVHRFRELAAENNILLRPHLKTSKSLDVAAMANRGAKSGVTVSTLKEAEYFAAEGYTDIMYAVGVTPNKFSHVKRIADRHKEAVLLITDNVAVARAAASFAEAEQCPMQFLVELDCGESRGGIALDNPELLEIARIFNECPSISFKGVMTHAGHSYASDDKERIAEIAEAERKTVVEAAARLAEINIQSDIISVGSTPTFLFAKSFDGLTEVRAGVYMFFDLAQFSRKICQLDDIAISVLATVIGHAKQSRSLIIDAGAFALSKDLSANTFLPDAGYGYVCDPVTMKRLGQLSVDTVHQEHGNIALDEDAWFDRLPIGSMVRILPNHACPTAASFDSYLVVENETIVAEWQRINRW